MPSNSNWRLEAISKAALNASKRSFTLKNGVNQVGKSKNFEVAIPSALCSRRHCQIIVENNCVSLQDTVGHGIRIISYCSNRFNLFVFLQSRNGTYINDKHIVGQKAELGHNDIISFGFNCLKLYNIKDKQAFIYRVIKEADLDTINIYDSDENDDANDDVVVVLDSDSTDGDDSEIGSDMSEATDDDNIMRDIDDDVIISSDDDDYYDSDDSIGSGDFVVTQRVKQPPTIDLNTDDEPTSPEQKRADANDHQADKEERKEPKPDEAASSTDAVASTSTVAVGEADANVIVTSNGTAPETNSTEGEAGTTECDMKTAESDAKAEKGEPEAGVRDVEIAENEAKAAEADTKTTESETNSTEIAKTTSSGDTQREGIEEATEINEGATKSLRSGANERSSARIHSAQPLRKRRRTITEREYEETKKQREQKRLARAERLTQIALEEKEKPATTSNGNENESEPIVTAPKAKISQASPAEMQVTDLLGDASN